LKRSGKNANRKKARKTITGTGTRYTKSTLFYRLIVKECPIHSLSLVKHILANAPGHRRRGSQDDPGAIHLSCF
jgi:hypothetical protein